MLWESAGAFPRDYSLVSAGQSHSSGVRGLVARCLSTQRFRVRTGAYALFFQEHSEAEGSHFSAF